jgi:predicted DNA binding CopG/RHH family protein
MSKKRQPIFDLDDEEQKLSDSFDRGEWKSTKKLKQEINLAKEAAKNYFREKDKISVSIQTADMHVIRKMAAERGLRPHTYIASILHQLAAGHIHIK